MRSSKNQLCLGKDCVLPQGVAEADNIKQNIYQNSAERLGKGYHQRTEDRKVSPQDSYPRSLEAQRS